MNNWKFSVGAQFNFKPSKELEGEIRKNLGGLGYDI